MFIAVDVDGTIVEHEYPKLGKPVPGAIEWMKKFQTAGAKLILLTMRADNYLLEAIEYLIDNDITCYAYNDNPSQYEWTNSRKVYANIYIDDAAIGCPLIYPEEGRPYVDWSKVGPACLYMLTQNA